MPAFDAVESSSSFSTNNGASLDGPDQSNHVHRDPRDLPSLMVSSCYPITLKVLLLLDIAFFFLLLLLLCFPCVGLPESSILDSVLTQFDLVLTFSFSMQFFDVCYRLKIEKKQKGRGSSNIRRILGHGPTQSNQTPSAMIQERTILNGITGMVSPGEILAVLGPSGSGKSTLLNALAGRLQGHGFTGTILANNKKLSKQTLKRTGFVTQDDILYPHLTVRETLIFCSLLRLPKTLSKKEKTSVVESVINELGLKKCENTIIGNSFIRGVSGGERKRVSIAHEMLINPSLLILDEPTSGLDSTAAHKLLLTLGSLAQKGKTIVASMHQPSSRVYQMFNSVLVLSEGRCMYFGKGSEAMGYFESVGFSPSFPMNPADFLLDLANGTYCLIAVFVSNTVDSHD